MKLHLGCGDDYIKGLINVDGNILRKKELWLDLRNRLPFPSKCVDFIYCNHTLEHLFPYDALRLLSEMYRIVSEEGVVRLAVPSFERCLAIADGEDESTWPRSFKNSRAQAINYLFCDGQHKYAYCQENLEVFALKAGFKRVTRITGDPNFKSYYGLKIGGEPKGSLIVELSR
ncbi:methyltransferase domain-containing protein [Verrucomicrobia bacterium]|nr:methyltransferase domain-containing protein [Verrucomicrobiota bacterium]MDA7505524.1 methyltransferase domain-containing protein [Verrucomicrobiota bacterium]MDA7629138.1 methyltransferase domain-containing protein [Verrucomicrobiota bacterium]